MRLRPPVISYVGALQAEGYAVFVAAAGDGQPPEEDRAALAATGATLVCRRNGGLDFGGWQDLIRAGCADGASHVLLANDSVFGPFRPLAPLLARLEAGAPDVIGMVESRQRRWHLQSWFLQFTAAAFAAAPVRLVFAQDFAAMDKDSVIERGELGLGDAIRRAGLRWNAAVRFEQGTWLTRHMRMNPTHIDWRHNMMALGLPFLKGDLLRENFLRLGWTPLWREVLRDEVGADPAPIDAYLYDLTGLVPPYPGAPFPTPTRWQSVRAQAAFLAATHDRGLALRALARG